MSIKYIAITIGPIYKTFQNVRKTRELWAASYIFSYISKRLTEELIFIDKDCMVVPAYKKDTPKGIGLFPDRIFLKYSNTLSLDVIKKSRTNVLSEVAAWIKKANSFNFLDKYFRIYAVEYAISGKENPLVVGNILLDTAELRTNWETEETTNVLLHFFRDVNTIKVNNKKWINDHLAEKDIFDEIRFESLPEISTRAIRNIKTDKYKELVKKYCYKDNDLDLDDSFIKDLQKILNEKNSNEPFKNYHKYVCIVKADGDKVGKYITAIENEFEAELSKLSKCLFNWGLESASLIQHYSGVPVYIGGDDLLFLAPVNGKNNQTIIQLTESLNACFKKNFEALPIRKDENNKDIRPTLSFGVSITYYKYPLFEALAKADELLYKSKKTRNTCSISLLKHSGSSFDISLSNNEDNVITNAFLDTNTYFIVNKSFVSSIIHHLVENEGVYRLIAHEEEKVILFLLNNFEEEQYKPFVKSIARLCYRIYNKNNGTGSKENSERSIREIYSLLRILKFLNGQEDGK